MNELPSREGYLPFAGYRTWYRVTGESEDSGKLPVLCLHGGPGASWNHMEPYTELAAEGRRVICYDQLGCGNSAITAEHDPSMWTTELFVQEVSAVRDYFGLERCHVLGHSWGGMLGMAYAITRPAGLVSLIVESSPPSVPFWLTELARLRADLPAEVEEVLRRHEAAGTTDSEEYTRTMVVFYDRHVCRLRPYPDWLDRTFAAIDANPEVYHTMNGPSEFHVIGSLRDWSVIDRLDRVSAPTLLISGRHDEATPAVVQPFSDRIPDVRWQIFELSSHLPHIEETEVCLRTVAEFIASYD